MSEPVMPSPAPSLALFQMITAKMVSRPIYVAAQLGLADRFVEGPRGVDELAAEVGADPPSLYRLLRALASVGIFVEEADGRFAQTPLSALLVDQPESLRAMALWMGDPRHDQAWHGLLHSVETGQPAFDAVFGMPVFAYFGENQELGELFHQAMSSLAPLTHRAVAAAYDFSALHRLVDVGGGYGSLMTAILDAHPHLTGVVFDLPDVVTGATEALLRSGLDSRCRLEAGSFFERVPAGGDGYLLSFILHDWDDERCVQILRHCRAAIAPEGRLLVIEGVVPPANVPGFTKLLDLEMLVMTPGGRERTEAEFAVLFAAAGFRLSRVLPTAGPASVIEGVCV